MRVLLLMNPQARRGEEFRPAVMEAFAKADCKVIAEPPGLDDGGTALMKQYRDAVDCVVVGGGDGTLIAAIPGLIETRLPLGILPLGTFNDLARTLSIPLAPAAAVDVIVAASLRAIDVGRVGDRYFLNEASMGISTRIARRQTPEIKKRFGFLAIIATTLNTLRFSRPFSVEVRYEGKQERFRTVQLTVANSHRFGGFITDKSAAIDDGMLDLYSLELKRWTDVLPLFGKIIRGNISQARAVRDRRAATFEVRTTRPHHIFTDGEPAGMTPAIFEVVPKALQVYVPAPGVP